MSGLTSHNPVTLRGKLLMIFTVNVLVLRVMERRLKGTKLTVKIMIFTMMTEVVVMSGWNVGVGNREWNPPMMETVVNVGLRTNLPASQVSRMERFLHRP